jgi:dienelactone hydrolase/LysM repeat protein
MIPSIKRITGLLAATVIGLTALTPSAVQAQAGAVCAQDVVVRNGDTLSSIAAATLGDLSAYPRIVAATNARAAADGSYATISDAGRIQVGWKLCIPGGAATTAASSPTVTPAAPTDTPAAPVAAPIDTGEGSAPNDQAVEEIPLVDGEKLTIDYLRSLTYAGTIVVEDVLAPGSNYDRYLVSYLSEGLKNYAYMTIPRGQKPATGWPAIIFNHGYIPPDVYRSTERYIAYTDGFARNGYVVFRPDYRGHGFSEGEARGAYGFPDYTIDVLNGLAAVKQHPDVDADRIGMWGHSMGGYITLRSLLVDEDIKAGVIWAGVVASYPDLINNWRRTTSTTQPTTPPNPTRRWRAQLTERYGEASEDSPFWRSISANSYLDELTAPIQVHHGTADASVPVAFSEKLQEQAEAAGAASELYIYPGDDHNLAGQFSTAMQRSIAFFDRYVKNGGQQ